LNDNGSFVGTVKKELAGILRVLSSESGIELQLSCSSNVFGGPPRGKAHGEKSNNPANSLSAIIYGPMDTFEDVGRFLQNVGMYLQDPQDCDRNVKYRNPHRLSGLDEDAPMTLELKRHHEICTEQILQTPVDMLSDLETTTLLSEAKSPDCLATELYR